MNTLAPKIAICLPAVKTMPVESVFSFVRLVDHFARSGQSAGVLTSALCPLDRARNALVRHALTTDATHVLFVDSDIVAPPEVPLRLLAHNLDVVSALYFLRHPPYWPCAFLDRRDSGLPLFDYPAGVSRVWIIGMGFALIRVAVFQRLRNHFGDEKWFSFEGGEGEDGWFGRRCEEAGILVHLDAEARCGHVAALTVHEGDYKSGRSGHSFALDSYLRAPSVS